jgi:hypothetical protein
MNDLFAAVLIEISRHSRDVRFIFYKAHGVHEIVNTYPSLPKNPGIIKYRYGFFGIYELNLKHEGIRFQYGGFPDYTKAASYGRFHF